MFREMRRKRQAMTPEETIAVLERGSSGVLALAGDDDYPYAVPISYVYDGSRLYFHSAVTGHKLDAVKRNCKASFCVVDKDEIIPEEYTTYFRSAIVFGRIRVLEDADEKRAAAEKLALKYAPLNGDERLQDAIDKAWHSLCMLEMTIDHMTGKQAIELTRRAGENPPC